MKLFPPQPHIDLYNQGFEGNDLLDRASSGKQLSALLERFEDPLVIAIDGPWGSGKSHFLQCWVGAHNLEFGHPSTTIYLDAFEQDYLDDPLIALTGIVAERLENLNKGSKALKNLKTVAAKLARPLLRIGVAVGTAGLVTNADDLTDAAIEVGAGEAEKAADAFWKKEDGTRAAMKDFRKSLEDMTKPETPDGPPRKLIVVVDELDRCRPDYALAMIERIKHFFAVPNVHFVLGVNLIELQNSVRARYGAGIDAERYLHKFITLQFALP